MSMGRRGGSLVEASQLLEGWGADFKLLWSLGPFVMRRSHIRLTGKDFFVVKKMTELFGGSLQGGPAEAYAGALSCLRSGLFLNIFIQRGLSVSAHTLAKTQRGSNFRLPTRAYWCS